MAVVRNTLLVAGEFSATVRMPTATKRMHVSDRGQSLTRAFPCTGRWLALLFVLGWAHPADAQGLLSEVNNIFNQRLETTCPYQEAVLPPGIGRAKRYLQRGKRRYLLETVVDNGQTVVKEAYWVGVSGKDTVSQAGQARYELSRGVPYPQGKVRMGVFHRYLSNYQALPYVDAGNVDLYQGFSPAAILALRPDTARTGQTLYVLNRQPDRYGDTLACYELVSSPTDDLGAGDTWAMVLRERATPASRRWRGNTEVVCSWEADRSARKVTAHRYYGVGHGTSYWVRTYATAALTDFTEVHYHTWPAGHAQQRRQHLYRRQFRQLSPQQSRDTYTVLNSAGTAESTFLITSDYRKKPL